MPTNTAGHGSVPISSRTCTLFRPEVAARTMDATIYEIIFGELGDLNCSLIEAFQDTFLENASLPLLSTDGKTELLHSPSSVLRCFAVTS